MDMAMLTPLQRVGLRPSVPLRLQLLRRRAGSRTPLLTCLLLLPLQIMQRSTLLQDPVRLRLHLRVLMLRHLHRLRESRPRLSCCAGCASRLRRGWLRGKDQAERAAPLQRRSCSGLVSALQEQQRQQAQHQPLVD